LESKQSAVNMLVNNYNNYYSINKMAV